mmetsp:Transcript_32739/g.23665  ORF Transcript_32739/g.23665 Transcript_32739/m.23665 type:complete len:117 (+) Transcript_32739:86-436(+)
MGWPPVSTQTQKTSYSRKDNPRVWMDVARNGKTPLGRMTFELYMKECPHTAENFRSICTGDNPNKLTYKGNPFHRIVTNFMAQGGDVTNEDGSGGESIYGAKFPDENLDLKHFMRG